MLFSSRSRNLIETGVLSLCASSVFLALTIQLGIQAGFVKFENGEQKKFRESIGLAPGRIRLDGSVFQLPNSSKRNPRTASYRKFVDEDSVRARFCKQSSTPQQQE